MFPLVVTSSTLANLKCPNICPLKWEVSNHVGHKLFDLIVLRNDECRSNDKNHRGVTFGEMETEILLKNLLFFPVMA